MLRLILALLIILVSSACQIHSDQKPTQTLALHWVQDQGFMSPESAIFDSKRNEIIVSNVNGYIKNQKGYLSKLSMTGELINQYWVKDLDGPTGMAIWQDTLYIVDIDRLVAIDLKTANIVASYQAPDQNPGLNDVTVSDSGDIYVTGSASQSVYLLANEKLQLWVSSDQLKYANGIYAAKDKLWVAGYYLRSIDYSSKKIHSAGLDKELTDLEGIESDQTGGFIITKIGEGPIYHMSSDGEVSNLIIRNTYSVDIEFIGSDNLLVVPSGNNRVFGFKLH